MPQHVIDPDLQQQPQCRRRGRGESPGRRRTCGRVAARHRRHGRLSDFADKVRRVLGDWDAERFNFLVNMAGTSHIGLLGEVTGRLRRRQPRPPQGPFFLTQTLLPLIADGGRIVNISSGLTRIIYPGRIAFGSMKGSVEVMTRNMTKELGPRRITVNTVAPGAIQTDFSGRRRARQPGSVPAHRRADRTRPARPSRRYWSDDRVASFGRQSLGERAAHRRVRRPGNLKRVAIFQLRPVRFSVLILRISLSRNRNHFGRHALAPSVHSRDKTKNDGGSTPGRSACIS